MKNTKLIGRITAVGCCFAGLLFIDHGQVTQTRLAKNWKVGRGNHVFEDQNMKLRSRDKLSDSVQITPIGVIFKIVNPVPSLHPRASLLKTAILRPRHSLVSCLA